MERKLPRTVEAKMAGPLGDVFRYMLSTNEYTYAQLVDMFRHLRDPERPNLSIDRLIDKCLQMLRRHGLITYSRRGKQIWWRPTKLP
jgi:hypothetical protein